MLPISPWNKSMLLIIAPKSCLEWRNDQITKANARNVSFRISLRWLTYIVNSVDKTKSSFKVPVKWNFCPLFYSRKLKSMLHWFIIFEFKLWLARIIIFLSQCNCRFPKPGTSGVIRCVNFDRFTFGQCTKRGAGGGLPTPYPVKSAVLRWRPVLSRSSKYRQSEVYYEPAFHGHGTLRVNIVTPKWRQNYSKKSYSNTQ